MWSILLHLLPASLYIGLAAWFWHARLRNPLPEARQKVPLYERLILLIALVLHAVTLHTALFPDGEMHFGFGLAISLMVWLAVCFYWLETFYTRLDGLYILAMPLAAIAVLIPLFFPGQHILFNVGVPVFRVHFIIAMLAYSLFTLAALHAMLMAIVEHQLHHAHFNRILSSLPPLLTLETLLFRLIGVAFFLLTLTLISGWIFSESLFGRAFQVDHKTVFAFTSWLLFGVLLFGRHVWGWRGRLALRWTLAGFITLMLAYVGSRFVIEVLLQQSG